MAGARKNQRAAHGSHARAIVAGRPGGDASAAGIALLVFFRRAIDGTLIARWREAFGDSAEIVNLYGPTETTMAKCYYRVPAASGDRLAAIQPVGRPITHTQALVLSPRGALCGIGELGEIVLRTPFVRLAISMQTTNNAGALSKIRYATMPKTYCISPAIAAATAPMARSIFSDAATIR